MTTNPMLDSTKKKLKSEESSEYNSLFIVNNDFNDFLDGEETEIKPDPLLSHSVYIPKKEPSLVLEPKNLFLTPNLQTAKTGNWNGQKIIQLKKHNFTNTTSLFEKSPGGFSQSPPNHNETEKLTKNKPSDSIHSARYNFQDSNTLLRTLRKTLQNKQKTNPFISVSPNNMSPDPLTYHQLLQKKGSFSSRKEVTPKSNEGLFDRIRHSNSSTKNVKEEILLEKPKYSKSSTKALDEKETKPFSQEKDFSEKTQEETNAELKPKEDGSRDSLPVLLEPALKDSKTVEIYDKNEIEGLDVFFESHCYPLAVFRLPVNPNFQEKKQENEILWKNCLEIDKTEVNACFLAVRLNCNKEIQTPFEYTVRNATESIKSKMKYDWQYGSVINNSLFNGTIITAIDKVSGLNFNVLSLNYEKMPIIQFYEDVYRVFLMYFLAAQSQKNRTILNIIDIYYTETLSLLDKEKKYILWVVFEPFTVRLDQIIEVRITKNTNFLACELLSIYKDFLADLLFLKEEYGIVYNFSESDIFYSQTENCLKILDLSFLFQIKNRIIHSMFTLNGLTEKLKKITDFNENFRIESFLKNLHSHPQKILEEIQSLTTSTSKNTDTVISEFLPEIMNLTRNEEQELLAHAKIMRRGFCYKLSNENYKKVLLKFELTGMKNDIDIKYKIGLNFFNLGFFEKAKGVLGFVREVYLKNLEKYHRKVLMISLIFAIICKTENDIDGTAKHFEEFMNLLKKYEKLDLCLRKKILTLYAFCSGNLANNLSHLKKSYKLFADALNFEEGREQKEDIINSLAILSANLGNYEQGLNYFKQIYNDQNNATTSSSKDQQTLEKKIILLSNMALINIETKNYPEAKKLLAEAMKITENSHKIKNTLKIKLIMNSGVLQDKMTNFYEAMKEFKLALHVFRESFPKIGKIDDTDKRLLFGIWINIAGIYLKFGDFPKSQKYLNRCDKILSEFDNDREKISAGCFFHNKGILNNALQKIEEAVNDVENALKIKRKFFEENNSNIFSTMRLLVKLHLVNNNKEKAVEYSEKMIEIAKKMMAKNVKELFNVLQELAENFEKNNEFVISINIFEKATPFINDEQITDSKRIEFFMKLASLYENTKNLEKSMEINEKLIDIYSKNKEENLGVLMEINSKMIEICKKTKKDESLKKYQLEAESLKVLQNNKNLLKKVGGKLLVSLKGVKAPKKIVPMPKN